MKLRRLSWKTPLALAIVSMMVFAGCSDDDNNPMTPEPGTALVRVAHLSPDALAVNVAVDGASVLQGVLFREISAYLTLDAGEHRVQVSPAAGGAPVIDEVVNLSEGVAYTVAATGLVANIAATVFVDEPSTASSSARVRFVHTGPDAPAVDVTLTDGTRLFSDVSFQEASGYAAVAPGQYDLQVRVAGTEVVALSFGDVPLANGTTYSVFATGRLSDGSLAATVAVDAPGDGGTTLDLPRATAEVRVAHLSPDAPNVDVWVDGSIVPQLVNVPFKAVSPYLVLEAATRNVKVYVTGTATSPVIDADLTLLPGAAYTVAATGLVGSADLAPTVLLDDRTGSGTGSAHVRFVHASPDAPQVDVLVAGGPTLFPDVDFRQLAGYSAVAAGSYDLEVRLSAGGALALPVPGVVLSGDTNYTVFAVGLAGNASLQALLVADTP